MPVLVNEEMAAMEEVRSSAVDEGTWPKRRRPTPVGRVVDAVLDRIGIREHVERSTTAARWGEVVGPHIDNVTRAVGLKRGTLFVEVTSAAWMSELNMRRVTLLNRLNVDRERGRIERLVFLQSDGGLTVTPRSDEKLRGGG